MLSTGTLVFVYLFGCAGSLSLRGLSLVVARGGSSLVAAHKGLTAVPSVVAERWLTLGTRASLAGAPALWSAGSVVVVCGLTCSVAVGIFPDWGSNLCLLNFGRRFSTTEPPGKPSVLNFKWEQYLPRIFLALQQEKTYLPYQNLNLIYISGAANYSMPFSKLQKTVAWPLSCPCHLLTG